MPLVLTFLKILATTLVLLNITLFLRMSALYVLFQIASSAQPLLVPSVKMASICIQALVLLSVLTHFTLMI